MSVFDELFPELRDRKVRVRVMSKSRGRATTYRVTWTPEGFAFCTCKYNAKFKRQCSHIRYSRLNGGREVDAREANERRNWI